MKAKNKLSDGMDLQQHSLPETKPTAYYDFKYKNPWKEHTTNCAQGHSATLFPERLQQISPVPSCPDFICMLSLSTKMPQLESYTHTPWVQDFPQPFTSFPAALHMALCSFSFTISSLYSSIASMIRSACTAQERHRQSQHTRQSKAHIQRDKHRGMQQG